MAVREELAVHGGQPAITCELEPRQRWGEAELEQLRQMVTQPSLFYWNGPQTNLMLERFREFYPLDYVMGCSSGTAALHIAVAAAGVGPGDEVITSPITDIGTLTGILYQQAVPVFADLGAHTYNLDPRSVREKITSKTKAIIAVHLAGNPCDLSALKVLCEEHDLVLIEDCAQAWGAMYDGQPIGTVGHIGCWSLNDFKHIACGDGGVVASNDPHFGPLLQKFGDKAYDRAGGAKRPDVLAPNYRISEPQSAVAAAQLAQMWELTEARVVAGRRLNELLQDVPGIHIHEARPQDRWTVWFYMFRVDPEVLSCSAAEFAEAMGAEGLPAGASYIGVPVYRYPMFQNHSFFAERWPIKEFGLTDMDYTKVCCPEAEAILQTCISFGVHEKTTDVWVEQAAAAIRKVAEYFAKA
jgi:dTDP-4-amino-4,6-dideoxygalactose transaminase